MESVTVKCVTCDMPGRVTFDDDGKIVQALFVCKCSRPIVKEANQKIKETSGARDSG